MTTVEAGKYTDANQYSVLSGTRPRNTHPPTSPETTILRITRHKPLAPVTALFGLIHSKGVGMHLEHQSRQNCYQYFQNGDGAGWYFTELATKDIIKAEQPDL